MNNEKMQREQARAIAELPELCELVALCDVNPARAEEYAKKYNVKAYSDYAEMLRDKEIDAVTICTPSGMHADQAIAAIEAGKHVLCEKPMSIKYEDPVENVNLAEKNNVRYGIIFQCRYNDASVLVKEKLDDGTLGKVISARVVLTWCKPDEYYSLSDWKGTWEKEGGGVVIDQAIHSIDLANWFINDEIESVSAHMANRNHSIMEVDDSAEGFIKYKNGATLGFWAMNNYGCDEPIEIRLLCENGSVIMDYDNAVLTLNDGSRVDAKTVIERLKDDCSRPLLQRDDKEAAINELLSKRSPIYEAVCDYKIDADSGVDSVVDRIIELSI